MLKKTLLERAQTLFYNMINPKLGLTKATTDSTYVFLVNLPYGIEPAAFAASRHFSSKFLMSGIAAKLCQDMAKIKNPFLAYGLGLALPFFFSNAIMLSVHYLGGTPKPLESIILSNITGLTMTPLITYGTRKGYMD